MNIQVSPRNLGDTIKFIENEWKYISASEPFAYSFLDEAYKQQYTSDERAAKIIGYFTIIAISIACMGLFGLSSFMTLRRTKQIGIRKALGASVLTILVMLSRDYIKWILGAALIACPIAWIIMNKWLQGFAYHISLGMDIFLLAIAITLLFALATVAWQSIKSALTNPVEALRYE